MKGFLAPTLPKIILYFVLFFIMPTYYLVCNDGTCSIRISFFVILSMLNAVDFGTLTIFSLVILSIVSYLISCFIVRAFEPFFYSYRQRPVQ